MSRVLSEYVGLPVPPNVAWSAAEWDALGPATRSPDIDQRYTTEVFDRFLVLKRSGRPVVLAQIEEQPDGSRRLFELGCEGDAARFNRSSFGSDSAITEMFIGVTRRLIDRFQAR